MILSSLSQILKECPFSVNMSTHIPTFLLLFIVWTLSTSTATNTTARPKKPIRPPPASRRPWRHVAGSAPCGAYGDAAPCAMAAGFGPLVVMAWHHLCWWKFRIKVVWSDFTWTPLILVDCDMWLDWKGMIFKWFVQSLCLMSENMLRLGMSMMMLQWQLISCRTRMLHISRCALQSTISWTWWLSFGAPIRQGTDSGTFPQKAWCPCNPTVVIITSILEYGVYSLNINKFFASFSFFWKPPGWLCWLALLDRKMPVIFHVDF